MRSLKWLRSREFAENLEWPSSPGDYGLFSPFCEIFYPGLSKSAPCKCCPSGHQDTTCTQCLSSFGNQPIYLHDSVNGSGQMTLQFGTYTLVINKGTFVCDSFAPASNTVTYQFLCVTSPTNQVKLHISDSICNNTHNYATFPFDSSTIDLPVDCSCQTPLVFTVPPMSPGDGTAGNFQNGATITLNRTP